MKNIPPYLLFAIVGMGLDRIDVMGFFYLQRGDVGLMAGGGREDRILGNLYGVNSPKT